MIDGHIQYRVKKVKRKYFISSITITMELVISGDTFVLDTIQRWAIRKPARAVLGDIVTSLWNIANDKFKALKLIKTISDPQLKRWAELRVVAFGDVDRIIILKEG